MDTRSPGGAPRLLYVEDDRVIAGMTVEVLAEAYDVTHVTDGRHALQRALSERFDARHPQGCDREAREPDERHGRGMPDRIERGRRDGTSRGNGSSGSSGSSGCGHEIGNVNGHAKSVRCGLPDDAKNSRFTCFS